MCSVIGCDIREISDFVQVRFRDMRGQKRQCRTTFRIGPLELRHVPFVHSHSITR